MNVYTYLKQTDMVYQKRIKMKLFFDLVSLY
jgi:hypothetical protein